MNKKYFIIAGVIILIILAGVFISAGLKRTTKSHYAVRMNTVLAKEQLITLGKNGFTPNEITIKIGTAIRWKNVSGKPQTVNSDNYPTNQLHKELNFGVFNNNSTVMYIFTKTGTYGYHNQFHHEQEGKVIVVN